MQFDGIDDFVEVPSSPSLDIHRTMTAELWMQADRAADGSLAFPFGKDWMPLVQKSSGALGARTYSLWLNRSGFIQLTSADTSGEEFVQTADGTIQPGQWYHVAGVIDRDTGSLRLFVHDDAGALVASTSGSVRTTDAIATTMPLEFGRTLEVDPTYTPFKGTLDEISVWNRVRTQSEIENDIFTRRSGTEAGLAGYWRFEEASGQTVFDSSVNGNHGGLGGATPLPAGASTLPSRVYPLLTTDTDDVVLRTTAISDTPGVTPVIQGTNLLLSVAPDTNGTATITLQASDREVAGRVDEVRFDFTTGANAICGTAFADTDRDGVQDAGDAPVENATLFLDANGNGVRELAEPITYSDLNGEYAFTDLPLALKSQTVFTTDFESGAPPEISGVTTTEPVQGYAGLGPTDDKFGGNFLRIADGGSPTGVATLTLTDLPAHTSVDLSFLLAIIDTWDGSGSAPAQPDFFNMSVDGTSVFAETFTNVNQAGLVQSYQPTAGVDLTPGEQRFVDRGFVLVPTVGDAAYDIGLEPRFKAIPHTGSTLTVQWFASGGGLEPVTNESWAIDNLRVTLNGLNSSPVRVSRTAAARLATDHRDSRSLGHWTACRDADGNIYRGAPGRASRRLRQRPGRQRRQRPSVERGSGGRLNQYRDRSKPEQWQQHRRRLGRAKSKRHPCWHRERFHLLVHAGGRRDVPSASYRHGSRRREPDLSGQRLRVRRQRRAGDRSGNRCGIERGRNAHPHAQLR